MQLTSRLKLAVSLLLIASVCTPFLSQSIVSGQYATTSSQSYPFDLPGTYMNGDTRMCSIEYSPGITLQQGSSLTGSIFAANPIYLAIVTTAHATARGHGCIALLGSVLYSQSGASFQFQWTAPTYDTYYIALMNPSSNDIQGVLTVNP